jgi:hypothetical protein
MRPKLTPPEPSSVVCTGGSVVFVVVFVVVFLVVFVVVFVVELLEFPFLSVEEPLLGSVVGPDGMVAI